MTDLINELRQERDALRASLELIGDPDGIAALRFERDALRLEVERLTGAMSWSEAKAHEDAAELRVERDALRAELAASDRYGQQAHEFIVALRAELAQTVARNIELERRTATLTIEVDRLDAVLRAGNENLFSPIEPT